jgi:opacity protein-like surface antigen
MIRTLKLAITTLLVLITTISGFAQKNRISFFINAAGYIPSEENIKTGFGTGLGAVFFASERLAVSLEWKYGQFNVDKKEGEFLKGTLYLTPLLASFRYTVQTGTAFSPYVFVGGGFFFSNYRLDNLEILEDTNIRKQELKSGMGFLGGIGSLYKINEKITVFIEGLYFGRTTEGETIYIDNSPSSIFKTNLGSFSILIGLNYFY